MFKATFYDWFGLNQSLFLFVNGLHNAVIDPLMLLGTALADYRNMALVLLLLAAFVGLQARRARGDAVQQGLRLLVVAIASYAVAVALTALGKYAFDFPRPVLVLHEQVVVLGAEKLVRSFPSGHSMFAMLVAMLFWPRASWPGRVLFAGFALWAGVSRLVVGAHFPADVMAGYAVGAASVPLARAGLARAARWMRLQAGREAL